MAHVEYYGEDTAEPYKVERKTMILNQKQLVNHNLDFFNSFIDLKVAGWKSYSKALNKFTFGFYKDNIDEMDKSVEKIGVEMKDTTEALFTAKTS